MSQTQPDYRKLLGEALLALRGVRQELEDLKEQRKEPIAVVGMGCRFPGDVRSPEDYWALLERGVDAISEVPADLWDSSRYHDPDPDAPGKICTRHGGFLREKDTFDPRFFRISPREATYMDPQQRLLLEVAWEALEDAGLPAERLQGSETGVFIGITSLDYAKLIAEHLPETELDSTVGTGVAHSAAAGRLSYVLGLRGPALSVDTACSSSLVAVHAACESLRRRECNAAFAGGVNLILDPFNHIILSRAHMLAPDGRCKAFDESANGYGRSEGVGVVLLKRLSDALAEGDNVLALIRGSAVNQDGASSGLTAPNGPAQRQLILRALENAGVDPADVSYVEAHGTGTALGDPIELMALGEVFASTHGKDRPLRVGSAKTNVGHMEAAAGMSGLLKVILQLQKGELAPHLHLRQPSTRIPWDRLPIRIPTTRQPWPPGERRRIAGVSSFGFSGTNVHLVLEEAPHIERPPRRDERRLHLLALSARTDEALTQRIEAHAALLRARPEVDIGDLCDSANAGRSHFEHRLSVVAGSTPELQEKLGELLQGQLPAGTARGKVSAGARPKVGFLFTGQGSQYAGMGRELYETQPTFRQALERCDELLRAQAGWSLLEVLYSPRAQPRLVHQTGYTQPLLFALEYALATLWQSWGIRPSAVLGHSVGEYAAACIAGVFSLEDGLRLIATRARLMQALPDDGGMVAVQADEERVREVIAPFSGEVSLAAINGPRQVVISGARRRLRDIVETLSKVGVQARALEVSHAFHSPLMQPILADFARVTDEVRYAGPRVELVSNVTGGRALDAVTRAEYWVRHVSLPVRFQEGLQSMHELGCRVFLELGPQATLSRMGSQCLGGEGKDVRWLPSLASGRSDCEQLLESLAELYRLGLSVDWEGFARDGSRRKLRLPTYPFQRQRYWFTPRARGKQERTKEVAPAHPLLGRRVPAWSAEEACLCFESGLGEERLAYLTDHRAFGRPLLPAAAYLELALAAGAVILDLDGGDLVVKNLVLRAPLLLEAGTRIRIQVSQRPHESGDGHAFKVFSTTGEGEQGPDGWELHAQGFIGLDDASAGTADSLAVLQKKLIGSIEPRALYERAGRRGLEYGPAFQAIRELRAHGDRALARICLAEGLLEPLPGQALHPVLLDAAFQALTVLVGEPEDNAPYLPTGLDSLRLRRPLGGRCQAFVSVRPSERVDESLIVADVTLFDDEGREAATASGLRLQRTSQAAVERALEGNLTGLLYHPTWSRRALALPETGETTTPSEPGRWLIFADRQGVGRAVAQALRERGDSAVLVQAEEREDVLKEGEGDYRLHPARLEHLSAVLDGPRGSLKGLLYLWAMDLPRGTEALEAPLDETHLLGCGPLLNLSKALAARRASLSAPMYLVTRGALSVDARSDVHVEEAGVSGLLRVIRLELPSLRCIQVDLEPAGGAPGDPEVPEVEVRQLVQELLAGDGEEQVVLRSGLRFVTRLERLKRGRNGSREVGRAGPRRVRIQEYGALENLVLEPLVRQPPGPGQVEVEVRAAGVNFKDVLHTLGMLKKHALEQGLAWSDRGAVGFECSGVIAAVGEGVRDRKVGEPVIAFGSECMGHYVTLDASAVVSKPDAVSFAEAAAVSTAFLTAHHALHTLACIRPGDRVLIHAGAGGVGQAAIQLCRRIGAEVFATASPSKWDFLKSQGIQHVMSSRTLDFMEQVLEDTGGGGVDVVLNSLSGDFISASFAALAQGGRFVEIGKLGTWTQEQVASFRPDVRYHTFDLSEVTADITSGFQAVLAEVLGWMTERTIRPLPVEVFPIDEVVAAFRHLAQARNIGKVVLDLSAPEAEERTVRPEGSYLLTGGLGALGLKVAEWLVAQGARQLVLVGRRGPSGEAGALIQRLRDRGARVEVLQADVAERQEVAALLERIESSGMAPLTGVIHAAGVLDDGLLQEQTWERFARVMAPKVKGAWNLHHLTRGMPLEAFVCFSSMTSLLGWPGQGNYAAANAFLDALMRHRRARGLPGLSVNWGPWADAGMAANLDELRRRQATARGVRALAPRTALAALGHLLERDTVQAGVASVDWSRFIEQRIAATAPKYVEALGGQEARAARPGETEGMTESAGGMQQRLREAPEPERRRLLLAHTRGILASALGFSSPQQIEPEQSLSDLGLDSLASVELLNHLENSLGRTLPASLLREVPTLEALVAHLHDEVLGYGTQVKEAI